MGPESREHQCWLIEPLLEAGLGLEEIRGLVFRLAFEAVVGVDDPSGAQRLVDDQPLHVQAAWARTIDRMIVSGERIGAPAQEDLAR